MARMKNQYDCSFGDRRPRRRCFLGFSEVQRRGKNCKATALVLTEEDKHAIWGDKDPERITVITKILTLGFAYALQVMLPEVKPEPGIGQKLLLKTALSLIRRLPIERV